MKKFSVVIANRHATSVSLEDEFYLELLNLAKEQNLTLNSLITNIDKTRLTPNLSSAIRIYILKTLRQKLEKSLK
ncbi:MAG: ribbon-helix-helix domain-containing protein [Alphaproteobacteria bacterium]|nr:ribbon-helix-helix domain-containing protein [Alphaproteobacteria bacterium]MBO5440981.1 ribbon-helix-helix domain-containing protein [Alphaproteobacteria bacterium]MBP3686886.1 ribbon-helix-helix domain-containing protein [Alphaproteobacteria bacterium]